MTTLHTAAQQALEALENSIAALATPQPLAVPAQSPAEGAGLRAAATQALATLEVYVQTYNDYWERGMDILEPQGDAALALLRAALAVPDVQPKHTACEYCDGTGDVHRADGEWLGECNQCPAAALHAFKNFHRLLCERFGYGHDEKDWRRDQLSLIEFIAAKAQAPAPAHATGRWTVISPDGKVFTGESAHRAANEANKHVRATDPAEAKKWADMMERLRAENEAENARLLAAHGTLDCPACGGSGHIGDVSQGPAVGAMTEAQIAAGLRQYRQRPGHRRHGDAFRAGIEFARSALAAPQPLAVPAQSPAEGVPSEADWLDDPAVCAAWNRLRKAARALSPTTSIAEVLNAAADLGDACFNASKAQPKGPAVPQGPRTEFVLNELRSALSAMTTFFGMDEDEASKQTFDKARQALNYAEIVMRPLEPWERQSLEDFRAAVHRWHEKAVAKGYDGVESMCDTALPYGTRDLHLVSPAPAPAHADAWLEVEECMAAYWDSAYQEAKDGREHDDVDGTAQMALNALKAAIRAYASATQAPAVKDEAPAWELPTPAVGDYVLATKWSDGDPGDNWALGFYTHSDTLNGGQTRHYVADSAGKNIRGNGFRKVHGPIRGDVGRWLLEVASKQLEASPPGVVNLWTMLTPFAFDLECDREPVAHPPGTAPGRRP